MPIQEFKSGGYSVLTPKPPVKLMALSAYAAIFLFGITKELKLNGYIALEPKPPAKLLKALKYSIVFPDPPIKGHKSSKYAVLRALNISVFSRKIALYGVLVGNPTISQKQNAYAIMFPQGAIGSRSEKLTSYVAIQYVPATTPYITVNIG